MIATTLPTEVDAEVADIAEASLQAGFKVICERLGALGYPVTGDVDPPTAHLMDEQFKDWVRMMAMNNEEIAFLNEEHDDELSEAERETGPGIWCVTESPENPAKRVVWIGWAANAVDALNLTAATYGYGPYNRDPELRRSVGVLGDEHGADVIGAWATFENTTFYSVLLQET